VSGEVAGFIRDLPSALVGGEITGYHVDLSSFCSQGVSKLFKLCAVTPMQDDGCAFSNESPRDPLPDITTSARDQGAFAVQQQVHSYAPS
jgi:hypothetical protein